MKGNKGNCRNRKCFSLHPSFNPDVNSSEKSP